MNIVTLSSKYQVTLPMVMVRQLGLGPQSKLFLDQEEETVVLKPIKNSIVAETAGSLNKYVPVSKLGKSWAEIMAETKKITARKLAGKK